MPGRIQPGYHRENMLAASIVFDLAVKVTRYKSVTTLLWERACSRWQHIVPPDTARCLHRGQARLPQRKYFGR